MRWPERPSHHDGEVGAVFTLGNEIVWREPDSRPPLPCSFRTCSYCGSIHPEDLLKYLKEGARLQGADWKYGWPHKFYVEGIPNPLAGQTVSVGSTSSIGADGVRREEPILGAAPPQTHAKWYNAHIQDEGFDDEALAALLSALKQHSGIEFRLQGGQLRYSGPRKGYRG